MGVFHRSTVTISFGNKSSYGGKSLKTRNSKVMSEGDIGKIYPKEVIMQLDPARKTDYQVLGNAVKT